MNTIQLSQNLAHRVQNGDYVLGHAILKGKDVFGNLPNKILKEGLIIEDASQGILFTSRYFEPVFEDCLKNLQDLSSNSSGTVIIISIPKELIFNYDNKYFYSCDNVSILLELTGEISPNYKDIYGNPTKIALLPSIYILGYLDVQKDLFIENAHYAFGNNNDSNILKLKLSLDKKYEQILKENQL